jgi:hypothetical protein
MNGLKRNKSNIFIMLYLAGDGTTYIIWKLIFFGGEA